MTTAQLTRADMQRSVNEARAKGERPDLPNLDLSDLDLRNLDLRCVDLIGAGLRDTNLRDTNLDGANLSGADLYEANLDGANLSGADLAGANLHGAIWDGLVLDGLHRYRCLLIPTPGGWVTEIGCWSGTVSELRELIAGDDWPESGDEDQERLRPLLRLWCDLADAHANSRPYVIPDLAKRWGES